MLIGAVALVACLLAQAASASASIQFDNQWGSLGILPGSFSVPSRAATNSSGNVFVTDSGNSRVQRFTATGASPFAFGALGAGSGQFLPGAASGVAIDSSGDAYVVDRLGSRVQKFNSAGIFQSAFGTLGTGNGQFTTPSGIAIDSADNIYVADTGNNRIQKFNSAGTYVTQWGGLGTGDGQFNLPSAVAVDSHGYVYVADTGNTRIQKFDPSGGFIAKWGSLGVSDGQFGLATTPTLDLAIGPSDNVTVIDPVNNRVEKFRPIGTFIDKWGSPGGGTSQFISPSGVATASSGSVYVVDQGNNRVQRFHETDTTAPDTTLDSGPSGTTGGSVSFAFSSTESPLLGFECRLDSSQESDWQSCDAPKAYSNLSTGGHTFDVRAVDAAGNPDASPSSRSFTVDATPPQTQIASGPSGSTNDASPSFSFTANELGSSFECRLDSSQASDWQSCSSPKSYSSLADGSHTFQVRATDPLGNSAPIPASRDFTIDTVVPPIPRITATSPSSPANDNNPRVRGHAQAGSRVRVYETAGCAGSPLATGSVGRFHSTGLRVAVPDNTTTKFRATATDLAGNASSCSAARQYVEDSKAPAAPSIKGTSPGSPANENQPMVRGFAAAPSTINLYATTGCSGSPVASGAASPFHSPGLRVSVPDNTTTKFRATATDLAGNTSSCSAAWRYTEDSIYPQTSIIVAPPKQTTIRRPTFSFESSEPGSTFRCRFDSQPFGRCSGPGASHTPYVQLPLGLHSFAVRATDPAGNADPTAAKRAFAIVP